MKRILITATAAVVGALLLAACGSSSPGTGPSSMPGMHVSSGATTGTPASGPHNTQDVSFATDMISHHAQAVTMAERALSKSTDPSVKKLAGSIKAAQAPEIAAMSGWLSGWGKPVPSSSMPMNHAGMSMPGMMSETDMAGLDTATGAAFDRLWLTQMIRHHQGAVGMAKTELASGQNPDAKALARPIGTSQSNEVAQMTHLLTTGGK